MGKNFFEAHVTGICSSANIDFCKELGCDEIIDYKKVDMHTWEPDIKFDLIYDTVSSEDPRDPDYQSMRIIERWLKPWKSWSQAKREGTMNKPYSVSLNTASKMDFIKAVLCPSWSRDQYEMLLPVPTPIKSKAIQEMLKTKKVKPIIDKVFPFTNDGMNEAWERMNSRRAKGKVVVRICK